MICPKCKTQNSDNAVFCAHCGFKLKVVCPKCKMTNSLNAPKCSNCGLRLVRFCPVCQAPNNPLSEKCKKCATPLLKKCKSCNALNPLSATHCKKCAAALDDKPETYIPHSTLLLELTNGKFLNENIAQKELSEKLIKKFFQTILAVIKPYDFKVLKLAPYLIGVEADEINDAKMIKIAEEISQEFKILNDKLANVNISYDVKILLSQSLSKKHRFGVEMLLKIPIGLVSLDGPSAMALENSYRLQKIAPGLYIVIEALSTPAIPQIVESQEVISQEISQQPEEESSFEEKVEEIEDYVQNMQQQEISEELSKNTQEEPEVQKESPSELPEEDPKLQDNKLSFRKETLSSLKNLLLHKKSGFIALLGESGIGKKTFLNIVFSDLQDKNFCLLQADCHSSLNTVPFATLQNLIRSMFSLPLINYEADKIKEKVKNALEKNIGITNEAVIFPLLNLLVPKAAADINIEESKQNLIFAVKELFKTIQKMQKVVLIIKEIEFIDKSSAEVFEALIEEDFLRESFLITTTSNNSHISAYIQSEKIANQTIGAIRVTPFEMSEIKNELSFYIKNVDEIPDVFLEQIKSKVQGWPIFFEEIILFLTQLGMLYPTDEGVKIKTNVEALVLPNNIEEIVAVRLDSMFAKNEVIHQVVANAVCLGYMFFPPIIQSVLGLDDESFEMIMQTLVSNGFLVTHDNINFKFKNKFIYEVIKNIVIKDEIQEKQINSNLLNVIININESNSSQTAEIAKKAEKFEIAFTLWNTAVKEAISTGDKAFYLLAQKEAIANIEYSNYQDKNERKLELQERLGIDNYLSSPEDAILFLSEAIKSYEAQNNGSKIIELCGYLVKSLAVVGSSQEALEYIDKALECIDISTMPLESALLKFLKLKFLIEAGYLGEVITLIQSDIMPSLQEGVKTQQDFSDIEYEVIEEAVLKSQFFLVKALSLQGNKNYYSVLELFVKNNQNEEAQIQIFVVDAMHKTLNGFPDESEVSIQKTLNIVNNSDISDKENILLELELIRLLNKMFYEEKPNVGQEISNIAQKSRKLNNAFVYNCIQLLFVKQLLDNKDYLNATNMVNECLNFFASQKIALFAIPSWMILSLIQVQVGDINQAVSIAQQAFDVASKPQIQNNYLIAYIKKMLSDYFMLQNDFEMAKMHLEQAIEFAKNNDLLFMQGKLYFDLANLYQKTFETTENKQELKETVLKLLNIAQEISTSVESKFLDNRIAVAKIELENSSI